MTFIYQFGKDGVDSGAIRLDDDDATATICISPGDSSGSEEDEPEKASVAAITYLAVKKVSVDGG